ncbi:MAG: trehalose-phosphatase, partial [Pseudomonadota bacterium]
LQARHPGLQVELKSSAISLHYRLAPQLESLCMEAMTEAVRRTPNVELMRGKAVLDIKPAGISKGSAIEAFMKQAPFAGRMPVFAGDDTTDEAGFAAVQAAGGEGIKIGGGPSLARQRCASPAAFRTWLRTALKGLQT